MHERGVIIARGNIVKRNTLWYGKDDHPYGGHLCLTRHFYLGDEKVDLNGTYRGFAPTDESGLAMGELELTISDDRINYRFATGLEIQADDEGVPRSELRRLTPNEVTELFEADANTDGITGYILGNEGAVFLFFPEVDEMPKAPRVSVLRFFSAEIDSIFFPVMLFTPQQVAAGDFEALLRHLETEQGDPGVIPRLSNDGKRIDPLS